MQSRSWIETTKRTIEINIRFTLEGITSATVLVHAAFFRCGSHRCGHAYLFHRVPHVPHCGDIQVVNISCLGIDREPYADTQYVISKKCLSCHKATQPNHDFSPGHFGKPTSIPSWNWATIRSEGSADETWSAVGILVRLQSRCLLRDDGMFAQASLDGREKYLHRKLVLCPRRYRR